MSLGPGEVQTAHIPRPSLWTWVGWWAVAETQGSHCPAFSALRLCPREEPDGSIRAHSPSPGSHCPPLPTFLFQPPVVSVWVEGGGCYFGPPPSHNEERKVLRRHRRQPQLALKLGQSGARGLHAWLWSVIDLRPACPCSWRVPSGPHQGSDRPLVLCSGSECEPANSCSAPSTGSGKGHFC